MTISYETSRLLIIRRDNIGDLVCTTPMFTALRRRLPHARLHALVNAYNAPVLNNHPDVDVVHVYRKAKHRNADEGLLALYADKARLLWHLRKLRFDYVIVPNRGARAMTLARWIRPHHIVGFVDATGTRVPDIAIPHGDAAGMQEAEDIFRLLAPFGVSGPPPPVRVVPDQSALADAASRLRRAGIVSPPVAVHIGARKPSNRWPGEHFVEMIRQLYVTHGLPSMLFWAPGDARNRYHPGDDRAAEAILRKLSGIPVTPCPTRSLDALIGGLACCRAFIGSDGGAMHLAAGVGLPVLAFFGRSGADRWRPWGVPQVILQPPTFEAADITVAEALAGFARLLSAAATRAADCSTHAVWRT